MTRVEPNDPRLEFGPEAMLARVDAQIGLLPEQRYELRKFMLVLNDQDADGNVQLAMCLLAATARIREDCQSKVGWGLHCIAEELARQILLVPV